MDTIQFIAVLSRIARIGRPITIVGACILPLALVALRPPVLWILAFLAVEVVLVLLARLCHRAITFTLPDADSFIRSQMTKSSGTVSDEDHRE